MATADNSVNTTSRYGIELDGVFSGFLDEVDGGDAVGLVVVEKIGADGIAPKHLGDVEYEDIVLSCDAGMPQGFFDWLKATFDGQVPRRDGAIVEYDFNYKEVSRLNFFQALITQIGFPALDAASKDAARMTVKLTPEYTRKASGGSSLRGTGNQVLKKWLLSNFRLTIAGLDCTRVNQIDALAVQVKVPESSVGDLRDYEEAPCLDIPNVAVTMAETDAQTFVDWHESFVIDGNNSQSQEKSGTLEYLAPDLKEVLFTLTLTNLGIFRLARDNGQAASDNVRRIKAEMYCERMGFTCGTGMSAPVEAIPAVAVSLASARVGAGLTTQVASLPAPATGAGVKRNITRPSIPVRASLATSVAPAPPSAAGADVSRSGPVPPIPVRGGPTTPAVPAPLVPRALPALRLRS